MLGSGPPDGDDPLPDDAVEPAADRAAVAAGLRQRDVERGPTDDVVRGVRAIPVEAVVDGEEEVAAVLGLEGVLDLRRVELGAGIGVVVAERQVAGCNRSRSSRRASRCRCSRCALSRSIIPNAPGTPFLPSGIVVGHAEARATRPGQHLVVEVDCDRRDTEHCARDLGDRGRMRVDGDRGDSEEPREEAVGRYVLRDGDAVVGAVARCERDRRAGDSAVLRWRKSSRRCARSRCRRGAPARLRARRSRRSSVRLAADGTRSRRPERSRPCPSARR